MFISIYTKAAAAGISLNAGWKAGAGLDACNVSNKYGCVKYCLRVRQC